MNALELLRQARTDADARTVARDFLLSCGYDDARVARCIDRVSSAVDHATWYTARTVNSELEELLQVVNKRKRERTIGMGEVRAAIFDALDERGFGWRNGGWPTASNYNYNWSTSCVTAVRDDRDGVIRVVIGRYGQRSGAWGISGHSDRATRPETIVRIRASAAALSRGYFSVEMSREVARCLTDGHAWMDGDDR